MLSCAGEGVGLTLRDPYRLQACREYVNRNAACPSANKSPELVARFADGLLRKSNKASEEADVEQALADTVRSLDWLCHGLMWADHGTDRNR